MQHASTPGGAREAAGEIVDEPRQFMARKRGLLMQATTPAANLSAQESQDLLGQGIGLAEHGCTCLLQQLCTRRYRSL